MPEISTLIQDIYKQVQDKGGWFNEELARSLSSDIAMRLQLQLGRVHLGPRDKEDSEGRTGANPKRTGLRLSRMGPQCPRVLWYSVHHPELAEVLPPWAEIKYSFGHILEALAIAFAKAAGHSVTGERDELSVDGIVGHRDCVIDGCVVDVKSASTRSFQKFKDGTLAQDDAFGYLDQLDGYVVGSSEDPLVTVKDKGYLLAMDKQLGHLVLYEHRIRENSIRERIKHYKELVGRDLPPTCTCGTVKSGESGNRKLDVKASYSAYKHCCFPELRTYLYAGGPEYLSKVVKRPAAHIVEVDKHGKIVYN